MSTIHIYYNYLSNEHTVEGLHIFLGLKYMAFHPVQHAQAVKTQVQCNFLQKTYPDIASLKLLLMVHLRIIIPALTPYALLLSATVMIIYTSETQQMVNSLKTEIMTHSPLNSLFHLPSSKFLYSLYHRSTISVLLIRWEKSLTEVSYEKIISVCQE